VKTLYGYAIALWLVSGLGLHAYFSRAAQGPAPIEETRSWYLRQLQDNDALARGMGAIPRVSGAMVAGGFAAWAVAGCLLAVPGVRALFRQADRVRETEQFLAGTVNPRGTARMPFPRQAPRPEGA